MNRKSEYRSLSLSNITRKNSMQSYISLLSGELGSDPNLLKFIRRKIAAKGCPMSFMEYQLESEKYEAEVAI